jgi:hypothetical protein
MTEADWLGPQNAHALVKYLTRVPHGRPSDRKFRLAVCAACRCAFGSQIGAKIEQSVVEVVERYADGTGTGADLRRAHESIRRSGVKNSRAQSALNWLTWRAPNSFDSFDMAVRSAFAYSVDERGKTDEMLPALVRCVFGNPFRPVAFNPAWRTDTAVAIARQMYELREFGAMPILADALQDAGCEDEQVLSHCRAPGPHVRGCWVVDGVLELA